MAKTATRNKPAASSAETQDNPNAVAFQPVDASEVELAGRQRSSKFDALKAALEKAKVGQSFLTDNEGDDDKARTQYRITLYAYMARFGLLVSAKPTKDGKILVTKRDPSTKRVVAPRKKKAS